VRKKTSTPQPKCTFRWRKRILTPGEAVRFIDATGFCMLFPVRNVPLPSLYCAATHRNPHAEFKWDRYSEMIWKWKSSIPQRKRAFYGKYFRGRGTFISLKQLPYFLAMHETAIESDSYREFYSSGRISENARAIWEALATHGPLATLELRNVAKMDSKAGNIRFKRAMAELQCMLIVVHFGTEQETAAWASGKFELVCRAFPKETAAARAITPEAARRALAAQFLALSPGTPPKEIARLFGWTKDETIAALEVDEPQAAKAAAGL
jgi:hypothetical protein